MWCLNLIGTIKQCIADRRWLSKLFGLILTLSLVFLLVSKIELEQTVEAIQGLDPYMILLGFFIYLGAVFCRASRFKIVLNNRDLRYYHLFTIVAVSNLVNNILPARTGELSYIYLLKKRLNVPLKHGIASLMVVRIFDVISISILLLLSILCLHKKYLLPYSTQIIIVTLLFLFISISTLIVLCRGKISVVVAKTASLLKIHNLEIVNKILKMLCEMEGSLIDIYSKKIFFQLLFISIILSITGSIIFVLILSDLMEIGVCEMVFITLFTLVTLTLPIQSFAGFGTYEGAWVIASVSLGVPIDIAILSSFIAHIVSLLYTIGAGIFGIGVSKKIEVDFLNNRKL